ncbi:hypothetical protein AA313_de0208415 [Arthrobotrys entomopaga]|nr:hypothetical protein AA313_de0208415 [Arthrobotrys entomopaga]
MENYFSNLNFNSNTGTTNPFAPPSQNIAEEEEGYDGNSLPLPNLGEENSHGAQYSSYHTREKMVEEAFILTDSGAEKNLLNEESFNELGNGNNDTNGASAPANNANGNNKSNSINQKHKPSGNPYQSRSKTCTETVDWTVEYTTAKREIYKFNVYREPSGENEKLFHHALAPLGTSDAWYIKIKYGALAQKLDLQGYGESTTDRGSYITDPEAFVYVSLRYIRFAVQKHKGKLNTTNQTVDFTGETGVSVFRSDTIKFTGGGKVSRDFEVKKAAPKNSAFGEQGLIDEVVEGKALEFNETEKITDRLFELEKKIGQLGGAPFRAGNGLLYWGKLGKDHSFQNWNFHQEIWQNHFKTATKHSVPGAWRNWRVRYDDRPLNYPLVVVIQPEMRYRFHDQNKYGSAEKLMGDLVLAINDMYSKDKPPRSNQVKLADNSVNFRTDYHELSTNPFGLFKTYIHKAEVNSYFENLNLNSENDMIQQAGVKGTGTPLRNLPTHKFEDEMCDYLKAIDAGINPSEGEDDDDDDDIVTGAEMEKRIAAAEQAAEETDPNVFLGGFGFETNPNHDSDAMNEDMSDGSIQQLMSRELDQENQMVSKSDRPDHTMQLIPENKSPQENQQIEEETNENKDECSVLKSHFNPKPEQDAWRKLPTSGKYMFEAIDLSSKKIVQAQNTRKGQKSQKRVMGFSASQVSNR